MINLAKLKKSFQNAFEGLRVAWQDEQSFRLQVVIAGAIICLMFCLPLYNIERALLVFGLGFVLGLELLNSQLERILDLLQPNHDPRIKAIKDLSAAAVLIAVLAAVVVGIFIFLNYLI